MATTLIISELFYSIQGESSYAGLPCVFIRLSGCNLRCSYCDARYTYEEQGKEMELTEILAFVKKHATTLVQITGGEPLLQEPVYPLMQQLLKDGRTVLLETNGSLSTSTVPKEVIKIIDVKCPDSGMADHILQDNLTNLDQNNELKFVVSSKSDYQWAKDLIHTTPIHCNTILFSPVQPALSATTLADWILSDQLPVKIQLQLHTILWPSETRGF